MGATNFLEHYNKQSSTYESVNSFKQDIARQIIHLAPDLYSTAIVLDNSCGPGIITEQLIHHFDPHPPPETFAVDFSPGMVSVLQAKIDEKRPRWDRVTAKVMDAEALGHADEMFTHSFTSFGIFLFPQPEKAAKEIFRTLKPGGVALVTSWSRLGWLEMLQALQQRINPDMAVWEGPFAGWMGTDRLRQTMELGGFKPEKMEIDTIRTILEGDVRDRYLEAMRDAWTGRITQGWDVEKRVEFQEAVGEEYKRCREEDRKLQLESAVAIARK